MRLKRGIDSNGRDNIERDIDDKATIGIPFYLFNR